MTDHNRGAYTPQSEAPLAFDARRTRGSGERPLPLTLLISAGILAVIVIALLVFLLRQPDGSDAAVATEGQTIDAMKSGPEAATPVTEPRPGLQVYTEGQPLNETPAFAPPPEQPGLRPTTPVAAPTVPMPTTTPTTVATPKVAAAPKPAPKPNADPVGALTVAAAPKPAPVASSGGASVQIGAFSSAALADKGWNDIAKLLPGQMAGKTKRVEPVERDGATLQRAFVGGFASRAEAEAFCSALQSRGKSCLVRN